MACCAVGIFSGKSTFIWHKMATEDWRSLALMKKLVFYGQQNIPPMYVGSIINYLQ